MMTIKKQIFSLFIAAMAALCGSSTAVAATTPTWAKYGVSSLNKKRSNETYRFVNVSETGADINLLQRQRIEPVIAELAKTYQLSAQGVKVDTIGYKGGTAETMAYRLTFAGEQPTIFVAKPIDQYIDLEFADDNEAHHTYYQLYAVSEKNVLPDYDDLTVSKYYPKSMGLTSLVPGLGQIQKGQTIRGGMIMGGEALLLASAIFFDLKSNSFIYNAKATTGEYRNAWASKTDGWRKMRNLSLCLAGGLYIANIIDATYSPGASHVTVNSSKKFAPKMAFAPMISNEGTGLSFVMQF